MRRLLAIFAMTAFVATPVALASIDSGAPEKEATASSSTTFERGEPRASRTRRAPLPVLTAAEEKTILLQNRKEAVAEARRLEAERLAAEAEALRLAQEAQLKAEAEAARVAEAAHQAAHRAEAERAAAKKAEAARVAEAKAEAKRAAKAAAKRAPKAPKAAPVTSGGSGGVWAQLRQCESGGNYAINTGNGYYGAYQFSASTWNSMGTGYSRADLAPPAVQDDAARRLQARAGWGQWPACSKKLGLR